MREWAELQFLRLNGIELVVQQLNLSGLLLQCKSTCMSGLTCSP